MNELIPRTKPTAPCSLKSNVMNRIKEEQRKTKVRYMRRAISAAAVLALLVALPLTLSLRTAANTSTSLFTDAATALGKVHTLMMKIMVRTSPIDNFESFARTDFTEHTLQKSFISRQWRLEKAGRCLMYDGENSYQWLKNGQGIGWFYKGELYNATGIFGALMNPERLMKNEIKLAKRDKAKTKIEKTDSTIVLTVTSSAKGIFDTDYAKDNSISTSDNRRIYTFDRKSKLLRSVEVEIEYNGVYRTVLKTESIVYNNPLDEHALLEKPNEEMKWIDISEKTLDRNDYLSGTISAEEAVKRILTAMEHRNGEKVKEALYEFGYEKMTQEWYGLKVISIGKAFHSGPECLFFVPCEVVLPNGKKGRYNLVVRHDNPKDVWILDGGF